MALPDFSMRQLLEAGVHFGHQSHRWNPKMGPFIFGVRNKIHIIDLSQTVPLLHQALLRVRETTAGGGRVLFVGTKRQASKPVADAAQRCGQYFINHRWLGGTLTNWKTISNSIKRLKKLEIQLADQAEVEGLTKKERLQLTREQAKLERGLGGIKEMGGLPDIMVVMDTKKDEIAVREAQRLNIPVVAVVDTNCDPDGIDHPIPGNDDAARAIGLYCDLIARAVLDGIQAELETSGVDLGESEAPPVDMPAEAAAKEAPKKKILKGDAPAEEPKGEAAKPKEAPAEAKPEAAPEPEAAPVAEPKAAAPAPEAAAPTPEAPPAPAPEAAAPAPEAGALAPEAEPAAAEAAPETPAPEKPAE